LWKTLYQGESRDGAAFAPDEAKIARAATVPHHAIAAPSGNANIRRRD
jgi:hypothetical protein